MNKENKCNVEANYNYYRENLNELMKTYSNEYIIIQDLEVIFNNKSRSLVMEYSEELELGTYIIVKIYKLANHQMRKV